ncbi:MAG: glycerol-3-phosphate dehydrogenase/oxidase [Myxococcota bacterium]|nr:glycerol-3-phosphate dehydrogenase/oxidase [Myxococcota bacterium]
MSNSSAISYLDRDRRLHELETRAFDCLVVGGGITGAGIAREAARRGLSVALVEADDFASGTSGRSSKLIHGGLRYLAQGDVKLVRDTARERKEVRRETPHLAEPVWMILPSSSKISHLKFSAAVTAYEKLGEVAPTERHRSWGRDELEEHEPALDRDRYAYACVYREYTTDDARLVFANLRAAVQAGAQVANRLRVESFPVEEGRICGAVAVCAWTGQKVQIRARAVVNAAGPWVTRVRDFEAPDSSRGLHLSKGIHVVLPKSILPVRNTVVLGTSDRRSTFVVPRGEVVYVGTTDTSWPGGPDYWPSITRADIDYLMAPLSDYFHTERISAEDCLATWSGLRPLLAQGNKNPTEISRRDEIWEGETGLISIAGGKLTGYRKMARSVLALLFEKLGRRPVEPAEDARLPGGDFDGDIDRMAADLSQRMEIESMVANRLVRLYGSESEEVLSGGAGPLAPGAPVLEGEVDWAIVYEEAACLEDFIYRRSRAAYYEPQWCDAILEAAARRMGGLLGWSSERERAEVESVRSRRHADLDFGVEDRRDS